MQVHDESLKYFTLGKALVHLGNIPLGSVVEVRSGILALGKDRQRQIWCSIT